jgi:hypothetical protein
LCASPRDVLSTIAAAAIVAATPMRTAGLMSQRPSKAATRLATAEVNDV